MPVIVGCGRSGTTLLRTMLDNHPDLAVSYEARFMPFVAARRRRYETPRGFRADRLVDDLFLLPGTWSRVDRWGINHATVLAAVRQSGAATLPDAVRAVYRCYAAAEGKTRAGEKTPDHVRRILPIARLLPETRFVHIVRDGRDVGLSLSDMTWGPKPTGGATGVYWAERVLAGRRAGEVLGPGRYLEVAYERLVDDPEPLVRRVCEFVELDYQPAMLAFRERYDDVLAKSGNEPHHARLAQPLRKGVRSWRDQMPDPVVAEFEAVAGAALSTFGFERRYPDGVSLAVRLRAQLHASSSSAAITRRKLRRHPVERLREWRRAYGPAGARVRLP